MLALGLSACGGKKDDSERKVMDLVEEARSCTTQECAESTWREFSAIESARWGKMSKDEGRLMSEANKVIFDIKEGFKDAGPAPTCEDYAHHFWEMRLADTDHPIPDALRKDPAKLEKIKREEFEDAVKSCREHHPSPTQLRCLMNAKSRADLDKCG
jgi:hypothetical protein